MPTTRQRTIETNTRCPQCGAKLHVTQQAITVAEQEEPVAWVDLRRFCPRACQYTAAEVQ